MNLERLNISVPQMPHLQTEDEKAEWMNAHRKEDACCTPLHTGGSGFSEFLLTKGNWFRSIPCFFDYDLSVLLMFLEGMKML